MQNDGKGMKLLVAGGKSIEPDAKPIYLLPCYLYDPESKLWTPSAPLPLPLVGAQAVSSGVSHVMVFGGHDGTGETVLSMMAEQMDSVRTAPESVNQRRLETLIRTMKLEPSKMPPASKGVKQQLLLLLDIVRKEYLEEFPPFNNNVYSYNLITNKWTTIGQLANPVISTSATWWDGDIVIPSGESRPTKRATAVVTSGPGDPPGVTLIDYAVILVFVLVVVQIGLRFSKKVRTTDDYFKAGRRIPAWAAGLSLSASALGSVAFLTIPGNTYATDWTHILFFLSQLLMIPVAVQLFIPLYRRLNVTTAYEYLEMRFNLLLRLLGALGFVLLQVGRVGIILFLPALVMETVIGLDIYWCILIVAGVSILYTLIGGVEALVWIDVLKMCVILSGAIYCLTYMISGVDGGSSLLAGASEDAKLRWLDFSANLTQPTLWVVLAGGLAANFIFQCTSQNLVQRYLTTKDLTSARRSAWINGVFMIPAVIIFFGLGTGLYVFYKQSPEDLSPFMTSSEAVLPWFIATELPPGFAGLLMAGILAASMSGDSGINSSATVITSDFYRRLSPGRSDKHYLTFAKWTTLFVGVAGLLFALVMAKLSFSALWDYYSETLGTVAGGLAGLFLLGMLSRRANVFGALVGLALSTVVQYLLNHFDPVDPLLSAFTGLVSCFVIGWLASVMIKIPQKDLTGLTVWTK
jgi:SSS family transporter